VASLRAFRWMRALHYRSGPIPVSRRNRKAGGRLCGPSPVAGVEVLAPKSACTRNKMLDRRTGPGNIHGILMAHSTRLRLASPVQGLVSLSVLVLLLALIIGPGGPVI